MKLAFISEHYPPTEGGVATSTQRIARELSRLGVAVQLICFDHTRPLDCPDYLINEHDGDIFVARIGPFFLKQPLVNAPESLKAILRRRAHDQMVNITRQFGADLILAFYLLNAGFLAQFVARALRLPLVVGARGDDIGRNIFDTQRFAVTQWVVEGASRIACVNAHLRSRLLMAFPDAAAKSLVIPNSVALSAPPSSIAACRRHVGTAARWNNEDLRVAFIGHLREKKGAMTLLNAVALLRHKTPVRLLVIGPNLGPLEMRRSGRVWDQLRDEGFLFATGFIPRSDVPTWASGCDVVVMPSVDDGIPNGLLEGIAMGLCPIVTPLFNEVVTDNETGLIVPFNDEAALADAMQALATDRNRLDTLRNHARASLRNWGPEVEAAAYRSLFESVLSEERDHV